MKTIDFSAMVVAYNFVIGVLVMLSSEKLGVYAGYINKSHREQIGRLTRLSTFAFGSCVAVLSAGIYVLFQMLRIGV